MELFISKRAKTSKGPTFIQYNDYEMTTLETALTILVAMFLLGGIGYVFYQHLIAAAFLAMLGLYAPRLRKKELVIKRKSLLQLQFKQALASLSSALSAGKSVENAFQDTLIDLRLLYPDPRALIVRELETINRRIENGETIELALKDLSERSQIDDIGQFTEVFVTCKRTGGNLVHVIRRTASIIQEKLDIQQEISVMMAQKRFESRVLAFAPVIVIAVLSFSSPDYMEPIYQGITGYLIMTVALVVLLGCFGITKMIMNIKV
ncbi:type II secretion system F family protein [Paenibacillus agricola]|nr:type II secretion system F family protein [Paenibacillus agricola]